MTMPHLSNCPHDEDGWCLKCVGEMHARLEEAERLAEDAAKRLKGACQALGRLNCTGTMKEDRDIFRRLKKLLPYGAPALQPPKQQPTVLLTVSPVVPPNEVWMMDAVTGRDLGMVKLNERKGKKG